MLLQVKSAPFRRAHPAGRSAGLTAPTYSGNVISIESLLAANPPRNGEYYTIAIDGRGASGKSNLATWLGSRLDGFAVVHGDDYFEPHDDSITWGDFNEERLDTELLAPLRRAERTIAFRPYDFPNGRVGPEQTIRVERGLVFERWFALSLVVPWDLTVWVETPQDVCLQRGLARDGAVALGERARLAWETVWQPREAAYIQETRPLDQAGIVVEGTSAFELQLR